MDANNKGAEATKKDVGGEISEAAKSFGRYLSSLRNERVLTQEKLAKLAHISRGYLALIEQGRNTPKAKTIRALAQALKVPVNEMLEAAGLEPEKSDSESEDTLLSQDSHADDSSALSAVASNTRLNNLPASTEQHDKEHNAQSLEPRPLEVQLSWAYQCLKADPSFNFTERMGATDLPPGLWLGFIEMYQSVTGRVLLKPEEIQALRDAKD